MLSARPALLVACLGVAACTFPTTVGFRHAGDPGLAGRTEVGGSVGAVAGGLYVGLVSVDADYSLTERVTVGGSLGLPAGRLQGQVDVRIATAPEGPFGASALVGLGASTGVGTVLIGPYVGGLGRVRVGEAGFLYTGAKVNPVFGVVTSSWWVQPVFGYSSAPARFRGGVEALALLPVAGATIIPGGFGAQAWLRVTLPE